MVSGPIVAITPLFWLSPVLQDNVRKRKKPIDRNRRSFFESARANTIYPFPLNPFLFIPLTLVGRGHKRERRDLMLTNEEERRTGYIGIPAIPPSSLC